LLAVKGAEPSSYSWRIVDEDEVALMRDGKQAGNYRFSDKVFRPYDGKEWGDKAKPPIAPPQQGENDALVEVNARRASKGLRPFLRDDGLVRAAVAAARYRADRLIAGHTGNDFVFLPAGCSASAAGCAAWDPSLGWGSCCSDDNYTYAGAAWSMGRDGRRYMQLYVR